MADLTIYLGNKNYSSWSLRPWLVLKRTMVAFDEVVIPLYQSGCRSEPGRTSIVRVCPGTSCGIAQFSQHQSD
jgi:hypothetical protein